ncbi:MAG: NYN domain-containing protein [Planctomycetota bacterium]|nr:NYN domain-containing protein [Planctomycetota bacterium]
MTLVIDGYNLLHASGVFGAERGRRGFEQSRIALLDLLLDLLGDEAAKTIVVFDAANAPDGLPGRCTHGPLRVWYAREYPDADSLIEEIVEDDTAPHDLVVVSSDRRLQVAARRRRATAVGSAEWLAEQRSRRQSGPPPDAKPPEPGPDDVERWKRYFGL